MQHRPHAPLDIEGYVMVLIFEQDHPCCKDAVRIAARLRMVGSRIFLRMRRELGVTSKSSSVSINSSACSKLKILGGVSLSASSALEERVLVSCFF